MCGICGFYGPEDKQLLRKMTDLLQHRGPDQFGYFSDKNVSLGHRRLSIIDLSADGKQPMDNENGTVWIVFNGEIYNYPEIKAGLEKRGHRFKSKTDTEVIVHAYEEFGEGCVNLFNGCFAFAIYDSREKNLLLYRDRMGVKPLYYTQINEKLYFASEIKSLLEVPGMERKVNLAALNYYLSFFANPLDETMFAGIKKIPPGHYLKFSRGKAVLRKYWGLVMQPGLSDERIAKKDLYRLLDDSVRRRLMSDVPLGLYLSGGIDSGTVASLMSNHSDKIKTFSVGFDLDAEKAELKRARITSEYFNTEHKEIIIGVDSIKSLPDIVWHQDEPMGDPTSIPTYYLSREAKKKVTVVLTGEGADEQFSGYEQEKFLLLHKKYVRKVPLWLRKPLFYPLKSIPAKNFNLFFKYMGSLGEEGKKRLLQFINTNDNAEAFMSMVSIFSQQEKKALAGNRLLEEIGRNNVTHQMREKYFFKGKGLLNRMLLFENKVMLAENLLMKVDKNTMAQAVEARVPFLDYRVVEFAARLSPDLKLRGMKDKYILRQAMKKHLPQDRYKQKKERFFVPIDHWLKNELKPLSEEMLSRTYLEQQGYFNPYYVEKMVRNYRNSPLFYSRQLWTILNFQLWHKMFIEKEKIKL